MDPQFQFGKIKKVLDMDGAMTANRVSILNTTELYT